jgi:hypothetical protein
MQVVDANGNVFGQGLEITSVDGKPKVPVINTDITIGTTAIVGGTVGRVLFEGAGNVVQESDNLFWDNANRRLGVGTSTPASSGVAISSLINIYRATGNSILTLTVGTNAWDIANAAGTGLWFINNNSIKAILFNNGNLAINTTTDAGFKLDVNGTARVSGQTSIAPPSVTGANTTTSLDIQQTWNTTGNPNAFNLNVTDTASSGLSALLRLRLSNNTVFSISKTGYITFGNVAGGSLIGVIDPTTGAITANGQSLILNHNITTAAGYGIWLRRNSGNRTATSGDSGQLRIFETFAPTSGTGTYNTILINSTINQTGGANGITRGLYINPTLTSAADFRAIETTNGKVIFGNLPTSSAGLPTGAIWNDAGTLKIV